MQSHIHANDEFAKRERLRRIDEIYNENQATTSTSGSFLKWEFFVNTAEAIQEFFRNAAKEQPIIDVLFPNHPGNQSLLSAIGYSAWSLLAKVMSPIALGFNWVNTLLAFKRLFEKENRSVLDYAAPLLSLGWSIAWTVLFAVGAAGAGVAVASVFTALPYLIPTVFGTCALYSVGKSVINCVHAYRAWRNQKIDECKAQLKNAGKQLLDGVINTLGVAASLFLGPMMKDACDKLLDPDTFIAGRDAVVNCFSTGNSLLYASAAAVATSAVINTTKMNEETAQVFRHPIDSIKRAWYALKADPVSAAVTVIKAPITVPLRLVTLITTGTIQAVAKGTVAIAKYAGSKILSGINWLRNRNNPPVVNEPAQPIAPEAAVAQPAQPQAEAVPAAQALKSKVVANKVLDPVTTDAKIRQKLEIMNRQFPSKEHDPEEIQAKKFHLEELSKFAKGQSKYRSVEEIERQSYLISRGLYRSSFRRGGSEVRELTEELRTIAAPAA